MTGTAIAVLGCGLGKRLWHASGHPGELSTELRNIQIGDGYHLLRISGELDEFMDHA
ncbi:MAG TPA: hypothetical protein VL179_00305 [Mycobacterium sp.]|nr:hypothetical protein [Mycobacterium sp.]